MRIDVATLFPEMCERVIWLEHGIIKKIGNANVVCDAYEQS